MERGAICNGKDYGVSILSKAQEKMMKTTVICMGKIIQSNRIQVVNQESTYKPIYQKIKGKLIEYYQIESLVQLKGLLRKKRLMAQSWIVCIEEYEVIEQMKQEAYKMNEMKLFYVPYMAQIKMETLVENILYIEDDIGQYTCVENLPRILIGSGGTIGEILIQLLPQLGAVQYQKTLKLYLDLPRAVGLEEISQVEDVLKEYIDCKLSIENAHIYEDDQIFGYILYSQ